jgi:hypothetical protein
MQAGRPYKDRPFPVGQFHGAIAPLFSFPSIVLGASLAPLRADDKRCDRLFPSSQFHRAIAGSIPVNLAVVVPSP